MESKSEENDEQKGPQGAAQWPAVPNPLAPNSETNNKDKESADTLKQPAKPQDAPTIPPSPDKPEACSNADGPAVGSSNPPGPVSPPAMAPPGSTAPPPPPMVVVAPVATHAAAPKIPPQQQQQQQQQQAPVPVGGPAAQRETIAIPKPILPPDVQARMVFLPPPPIRAHPPPYTAALGSKKRPHAPPIGAAAAAEQPENPSKKPKTEPSSSAATIPPQPQFAPRPSQVEAASNIVSPPMRRAVQRPNPTKKSPGTTTTTRREPRNVPSPVFGYPYLEGPMPLFEYTFPSNLKVCRNPFHSATHRLKRRRRAKHTHAKKRRGRMDAGIFGDAIVIPKSLPVAVTASPSKKAINNSSHNNNNSSSNNSNNKKSEDNFGPTRVKISSQTLTSPKDISFAQKTLKGLQDLSVVLSDEHARWLGKEHWIFTVQQLQHALTYDRSRVELLNSLAKSGLVGQIDEVKDTVPSSSPSLSTSAATTTTTTGNGASSQEANTGGAEGESFPKVWQKMAHSDLILHLVLAPLQIQTRN